MFDATVQAVEEAIINAMVAAETMEGINGNKAHALPHTKVKELLKKYAVQPAAVAKIKTEIKLSDKILNRYIGTYEVMPGMQMVITVEDGQLLAQATGQPKVKLFAEKENYFFIKEFEANIEFVNSDKGIVERLLLHQGGQKMPAKKIK